MGNPLKTIRAAVVSQGSTAVLRALRARLDPALLDDPSPLWTASAAQTSLPSDYPAPQPVTTQQRASTRGENPFEAVGSALADGMRALSMSQPPLQQQWDAPAPRHVVGSRAGAPTRVASARAPADQWDYAQQQQQHQQPPYAQQQSYAQPQQQTYQQQPHQQPPLPRRESRRTDPTPDMIDPYSTAPPARTTRTDAAPAAQPRGGPQEPAPTNSREAFMRNRARAHGSTSLW